MIRELLRQHTQSSHERLESSLNLLEVRDLCSYSRVIERFYGFVSPLEAKLIKTLAQFPLFQDERLRFSERVKTKHLEADMAFVSKQNGMPQAEPKVANESELPRLESPGSILGCLYVMEGSTLGGQFLTTHFEKALGLKPEEGLSYFSGYRSETGKMWRAFLAFLEESVQRHPEWTHEVLASANETFEKMGTWLT